MFTKLRGVPPEQIDQAIDGFTDADWDHIDQAYLGVLGQLVMDFFDKPLGLDREVDGVALYCRLYRISCIRAEATR